MIIVNIIHINQLSKTYSGKLIDHVCDVAAHQVSEIFLQIAFLQIEFFENHEEHLHSEIAYAACHFFLGFFVNNLCISRVLFGKQKQLADICVPRYV